MAIATTKKASRPKRAKARISYNCVAEVMEKKGIIAEELADLLSSNPSHVSLILNNKRPCVSLPIALKIGKILNTPVEELFFIQDTKKAARK